MEVLLIKCAQNSSDELRVYETYEQFWFNIFDTWNHCDNEIYLSPEDEERLYELLRQRKVERS